MKLGKTLMALVLAFCLSGCMNLYVRCPGTMPVITDTYQCTEASAGLSYVVMFPQTMMPSGGRKFLFPENLISIPIGCLCFVDVVGEAAIDTVCYPFDLWIENSRGKTREFREDLCK